MPVTKGLLASMSSSTAKMQDASWRSLRPPRESQREEHGRVGLRSSTAFGLDETPKVVGAVSTHDAKERRAVDTSVRRKGHRFKHVVCLHIETLNCVRGRLEIDPNFELRLKRRTSTAEPRSWVTQSTWTPNGT